MKKILIFIFTLLSYSVSSQNFRVESGFNTNNIYHFEVNESQYSAVNPEKKNTVSILKYIDVSFTKIDTGLACVWKYKAEKAVYNNKILGNSRFSSFKQFEVEIYFNPQQAGIVLLNYKKLKEDIKVYLTDVDRILNQTLPSTKQFIDDQITETCSTPEDLLSTYFPEINLYFELYSQNIKYGVELLKDDSFPNPFKYDGDPFSIQTKTIVDDTIENTMVVKKIKSTNKEETDSIIYEMAKSMIKPGGSPLNKEKLPNFTLNIETNYYYEKTSKLIKRITYNKVVSVNGVAEVKNIEVKLIE